MGFKKSIINQFVKFVDVLHLRNYIVMEIEPGRADNTEYVLQEMLRRNWNQKYRFAVVCERSHGLSSLKTKHVEIIQKPYGKRDLISRFRLFHSKARARLIIDVNVQISKISPKTTHVFLSHGSPLKGVKKYYSLMSDTDYMLDQADFWKPIISNEFSVAQDKLVTLGFPRNDSLFSHSAGLKTLFGKEFSKIVVWCPTFRHHKNASYREGFSIPVIHDQQAARKINEYARQFGVLVIVKPHPGQTPATIQDLKLSNIRFVYNDFFVEHGINAYDFLGEADALITDYSSVFYDYLITKKPIALTFEDYKEYSLHHGFIVDTNILKSCSEMLDTPDDFARFFKDLTEGNDPHYQTRMEVMHLTNKYVDGNSTSRVVDWLDSLLNTASEK